MNDSVDFSGIFHALPGNYIILLPDAPRFTIVAFNETRAEQTFTRMEHIGKGIFEAFPDNPEDPHADGVLMLTASLETVVREKKFHQMALQKYDIPTADRTGFEERYWLPRNIPVLDAKGEIIYIIHHVQDMTTQVLAENREKLARLALSEQISARKKIEYTEETTRLALDSANLGTYEINLITEELTASPRFIAIWGFEQPANAAALLDTVHNDDKAHVLTAHQRSLHTGNLFYEARAVGTNKETCWVRMNGQVIYDNEQKPFRLIGVAQDITEQRAFTEEMTRLVDEKTKELQKLNERLELSNSELEQFAYVTSHDLQEPLRKIQVYASRLMEKNEGNTLLAADLEKISGGADRLRRLITHLLDYSRLSDTNIPFQKTDLNKVISEVLSDLESHINLKNAAIRAEKLETIDAVPLYMNQLFINLLGNSLKFAKKDVPVIVTIKGSKLEEDKRAAFPSLLPNREYYEIVLTDNGIGFDQIHADKIFSLFQRLGQNGDTAGHGIGLALCSKVVKFHNGIIRAESAVNGGASFTIILPCSQS